MKLLNKIEGLGNTIQLNDNKIWKEIKQNVKEHNSGSSESAKKIDWMYNKILDI